VLHLENAQKPGDDGNQHRSTDRQPDIRNEYAALGSAFAVSPGCPHSSL